MHGVTPKPKPSDKPIIRSRRLVTVVLGTMTAFAPLSVDMYLPAFPAIQKAMATTPGAVQITLAAFFIAFAGGQIVYGPLTDRFGRKPPLFAGLIGSTMEKACEMYLAFISVFAL